MISVFQRSKNSPSRQQRHARRAAARGGGKTAETNGDTGKTVAHAGKAAEQEKPETIAVEASSVSGENSLL